MRRSAPRGERPSASRIDDLGSAHTGASPQNGPFSVIPEPPPTGIASVRRASALLRTKAPMR
jgi:hypothetical protein